jgi:hypothetical protein
LLQGYREENEVHTILVQVPADHETTLPVDEFRRAQNDERLDIKDKDGFARLRKVSLISRSNGIALYPLAKAAEDADEVDFAHSGFAVDENGVAIGGVDPLSIRAGNPVAGNPAWPWVHGKAIWLFEDAAARDRARFPDDENEPDLLPAVGGYDALALARGELHKITPTASWTGSHRSSATGITYLFATADDRATWVLDPKRNRRLAERNYAALMKVPVD